MRWTQLMLIVLLATVSSSCSSTRWVHPSKKGQQYTYDYDACDREILNRQVTNPGVTTMYSNVNVDRDRVAACLQQTGWREIEDE